MTGVDSGEMSSREGRMKCELQVLVHVMQEVSRIEIAEPVEHWLKKESIQSVTDLLMMTEDDMAAAGWLLTLREKRAFEHLFLWWGDHGASDETEDLKTFMDLTRDEFRHCIVQTQLDDTRKKIKAGALATSVLPGITTVDGVCEFASL